MRKKLLSTDHTMFPLDYDKNNMSGLQEWRDYIHAELQNSISPEESLVVEANKILTTDSRYVSPRLTQEQKVKGDRIIYVLLFISAISIALLWNL